MIIKSMKAVFGTLDGGTLSLNDGLNIITLPNEAGKSTWSAFICAMLYGIDTSKQDKPARGILAAKNKYRPWSGSLMEGVMECSWRGSDITLQRSTKTASAPMQDFSAFYTASGEPVSALTASNAGETLLGMGRDTFLRSAFISQTGMTVSQTPELERRIQAIFSSGDEHMSYSEADMKLREWQRALRYNKSGRIPSLEAEIALQESFLSHIEGSVRRAKEIKDEIEVLGDTQKRLSQQLKLHIEYEINERNLRIWTAKAELDKARSELDEIDTALGANSPDRDTLLKYMDALESLGKNKNAVNAAEHTAARASDSLSEYEKQLSDTPFKGLTDEEAWARANAAAETLRFYKRRRLHRSPALYAFSALLFLALGLLGYYNGGMLLGAVFAAAGIVVASILMIFVFDRNSAALIKSRLEISRVVSEFGTDDPGEILILISKYQAVLAAFSELKIQRDRLSGEYTDLLRDYERQRDALLNNSPFSGLSSTEEAASKTAAVLSMHTSRENALLKYSAAKRLYESLLDAAGREAVREPDMYLPAPDGNKEQLSSELESISARLAELESKFSMLKGEFMALGDPDVIRARLSELTNLKNDCEYDYSAIELCLAGLSEANNKIRERFSPLLNERTGEIMSFLTNGRFKKISLDREFNAHFEIEDDIMMRKSPYMSIGSYEQLYLSLRLAICDIALDPEYSPPLILDDALAYFDDTRMKRALDYLKTLSSKRQVILFTCHKREMDYLDTIVQPTV